MVLAASAVISIPTAIQASVTASVPTVGASFESGPPGAITNLSASFQNLGNLSTNVPPLVVPVLNQSGVLLPLGPASTLGEPTASTGGLKVPTPSSAPSCASAIDFERSTTNVIPIGSLDWFGPSTISVVLSSPNEWPSLGVGLLLPFSMYNLIALQPTGPGSVNVTVAYYNYSSLSDYQLIERSPSFLLHAGNPTELTISEGGSAAFTVSVNGQPRLGGNFSSYSPAGGPVALWPEGAVAAVQAVVAETNGDFQFLTSGGTCESLELLPATSASPVASAGATWAREVEPTSAEPSLPDLVVVEMLVPSSYTAGSIDVSGLTAVPLGVSSTQTVSAPLEV